jgi:hypothetical protein
MASNIPGASGAGPGVYTEAYTLQQGVSVPVGSRIPVLMGEGLREEVLVGSANGDGNDGFDSTYTTTTGSNGRRFLLGNGQSVVAPVITNRSRLYKNGVELNVIEDVVDTSTFPSKYDARIDPVTGRIELQGASLVDQGGSYYSASITNVGNGTISNLTLVDANAPAETWTIRCSSVRRDGYGNPVDGYARFIARGSESGVLLDGYGNQIVWMSNGVIISNSVLRFSIAEGATNFLEGDTFTIRIQGGSLVSGDRLTVKYISQADLNTPQYFTDLNSLMAKHGQASETNVLSLGAQLAWSNGTPGVYTIQTMPAIPRRVSYQLAASANGQADIEDLTFELPMNIVPDADSNINFFVTNPITNEETQIIPNKVDFYNSTYTLSPSSFVFGANEYSYTVIMQDSVQKTGTDGVLTVTSPTTATLTSSTVSFGLEDISATRSLRIDNSTGNSGIHTITGVSLGALQLTGTFGTSDTAVEFFVLDSTDTSARILFTDDLALSLGEALRCTVVDTKDADFFDAGWVDAFEAAEKIEIDIVVPLPTQTISAITQNAKVHCETMSNIVNKKERILLTGAISGLAPDNVLGNTNTAVEDIGVLEGIQGDDVSEILAGSIEDSANYDVQEAFGDSFRVEYFYPDEIVVRAGSSNITVNGLFIAAAAAGYFSASTQIQEPLTNKVLSGFTIASTKLYGPIVERNLNNHGISLLKPVSGGGRVVWGKTTTNSLEATEEEISIVFIRDAISKGIRKAFQPYIGRAETSTTKATLYQVAQSLMKSYVQQKLITTYSGLTVNRDAVEPRQWNVDVYVQPTYGINWVFVRFGVGRLD